MPTVSNPAGTVIVLLAETRLHPHKTRKEQDTMAIEDIQLKGSWYEVYGEGGKKLKSLGAASVGDLCGFSNELLVFKKGSWFEFYDETGKKLKSLGAASVGDFRSVSGRNVLFKKGSWIDTYDITGKKINTRSA